ARPRVRVQTVATLIRPSLFRSSFSQLVSSSLYKTRAFFRYLLGRNVSQGHRQLPQQLNLVRNVAEQVPYRSTLTRWTVGERFHAYRGHNARFRWVNRRLLTNTGLTFGLVGVYARNEDGSPTLAV